MRENHGGEMRATGEQAIELILSGNGVKLEREYRFNSATRHRFDFAIPEHKIALEYEGAVYAGGRHVRGKGYSNDCIKYNIAACLGWTVLRYTSDMLRDNPGRVLDDVLMLIKNRGTK
jgi:very-short-patch-repair endonuclease